MVFIREVDTFSMKIKGFVSPDVDGNYNVYVHSDLSDDVKKDTIIHELMHIVNGDCESDRSVKDCEGIL